MEHKCRNTVSCSMNSSQIAKRLRVILDELDVERDGLVSRKKSTKHDGDVAVLLDHLAILIADLRFDAEASRREMFELRKLIEEER